MQQTGELIKVVLDTNVSISALLWEGIPHQLLKYVEAGIVASYATVEMLDELAEVLKREKFARRIAGLKTSADELMLGVIRLVQIVGKSVQLELNTSEIPKDDDDVIFIECAIIAGAQYIVSGDPHLIDIGRVRDIQVLSPSAFLQKLKTQLIAPAG